MTLLDRRVMPVRDPSEQAIDRDRLEQTIWISEAGAIRPVRVTTGVTDATAAEIAGGSIKEGARVVTRIGTTAASQSTTSPATARSPLMTGPSGPPPPR